MVGIQINTSILTHTQFLIPELSADLIEGASAPIVHLEPGEYTFQMPLLAGLRANFKFQITPEGLIDYAPANDGFLQGRGTTTLTVLGFKITLDGRSLSHDLMFNGGIETIILTRDRTHDLTLIPGTGYSLRATPNKIADCQFTLNELGQVKVDPQYAKFATANGSSLTINGYRITIDGRALSHDLRLYLIGNDDVLSRSQIHELTLLPTAGYTFWSNIRALADFRFDLSVTGQLALDPQYINVATAQAQVLKLKGYPITLDGRSLSYDLELSLVGTTKALSRNQAHELTILPGTGYAFQAAPKIPANFQFDVDLNGQIAIDPQYVNFAIANGRSLILKEITKMNWEVTGNNGTDATVNFLGTTDEQPLVIKTNSTEALRVNTVGQVGIGTPNPQNQLHVGAGVSEIVPSRVNAVFASLNPDAGIAIAQNSGVNVLLQASGAGGYIGTTSNHPLVFRTNDLDRMVVEANGNLRVGSGSSSIIPSRVNAVFASVNPDAGIAIAQNGGVNVLLQASGAGGYIGTTSNHPLVFRTNDLDRMVVETNGNLRVMGEISGAGVRGTNEAGIGVFGQSANGDGVRGVSTNGNGVAAFGGHTGVFAKGPVNAGFFEGNIHVTGDITTAGDVKLFNADCAEDFDIAELTDAEPGTVMVINSEGTLEPSDRPYDKRVAGVISGAGKYKPALILDKQKSDKNRRPIALMGKVYCKVDASYGAIEVGDLLTTSPTLGHAMKANDPLQAFGAVIGKALRPLATDQDLIPILIALQ